MALKLYNPRTDGQRGLIGIDRSSLWKGGPKKALTKGSKRTGGRNNTGRITSWHKGGGTKRLYRSINFKRDVCDMHGVVERIEYDPFRTAFIALIKYEDNKYEYIIAPNKLNIGDKVISSEKTNISIGNTMLLKHIPVGTFIHNIELKPGKGGQIARSAGAYASVVGQSNGYAQVKLSSGSVRLISLECRASIGIVSNLDKKNTSLGKAGRSRNIGRRPVVRGVAMNPVDHPHGGGEGKTSGGRHPVTPWGKGTKGKKTRRNKSTNKYIVKHG